jgi:hypothetical protein
VSNLKLLKFYKGKRETMKVNTNVKAGATAITLNHNEKMADDSSSSIEQKKSIGKKLRLNKETIRELKSAELKLAGGGAGPITSVIFSCLLNCR